jgi:hypothetical protein
MVQVVPPHLAKPILQVQTPAAQYWFCVHMVPHAPQLSTSVCKLTQPAPPPPPPHEVRPLPHTQIPDVQVVPPGQSWPHAPQLCGSLEVCAQLPAAHLITPAPVHVHCPLTQAPPVPHENPQRPQLSGSVAVSTHPFGHAIWFPGHMAAHTPPTQTGVGAAQAWPHEPQFARSVLRLTHAVPQVVLGALQGATQ